MKINFKGKDIEIPNVKECKGLAMGKGLMFSRREKAKALLFNFSEPTKMAIHSFFVCFPFIAVWLDEKNQVIEIKKIKPFVPKASSVNLYYKLLEIPINKTYQDIVKILVEDRKI